MMPCLRTPTVVGRGHGHVQCGLWLLFFLFFILKA